MAGDTIAVWNAWLTGSGTTTLPIAVNVAAARSTAADSPPITDCDRAL